MSTFRLEPEHFHLTTGTFNLIVKDRIASRLSGALSVRTDSPEGNPYVLETFQPYRVGSSAVNPLQSQDFHLFCTIGSCHPGLEKRRRGELFTARNETRLPLEMAGLIRLMPKRKTVKSSKIAGRFCFSRNPSGTLSPNADPGSGSNRGLLNWMPRAAARMQASLDTQSLSSTLLFIPERAELCKGESERHLLRQAEGARARGCVVFRREARRPLKGWRRRRAVRHR